VPIIEGVIDMNEAPVRSLERLREALLETQVR
jgi:hypothetical protein